MYTPEDRENVLNKLSILFPQVPNVEGVILVGSGAKGFFDEYSDVDLSVVVEPAEETNKTWSQINNVIKNNFDVFHYSLAQYGDNNYLTLFILTNYLQIDVGVIALDNLIAKRPLWNILYDKNSRVLEKMKATEKLKQQKPISDVSNETTENLHYHTQNAAFAIRRNRVFRAAKEIEEIRELTIKLFGIYNNLETKHHREVDDFDDSFKKKLIAAVPEKLTIDMLSQSLVKNIDMYFEVIKMVSDTDGWNKDEMFIKKFINEVLLLNPEFRL